MRIALLTTLLGVLGLCSCSTIQSTTAKIESSTKKTFQAAKDKTLALKGESTPKLRLTKADPSRYLPTDTPLQTKPIQIPATLKKKSKGILLAKNTLPSPKLSARKKPVDIPLELPTLPKEEDLPEGASLMGVLPALDGSALPELSEEDRENLELPPLPEIEEANEEVDQAQAA